MGKQLSLENRKVLPTAEEGKFPVSTAIKTQQSEQAGHFSTLKKKHDSKCQDTYCDWHQITPEAAQPSGLPWSQKFQPLRSPVNAPIRDRSARRAGRREQYPETAPGLPCAPASRDSPGSHCSSSSQESGSPLTF